MSLGAPIEIRAAQASEADALSELALEAKAQWGYSRVILESWRESLRISPAEVVSKPVFVGTIQGRIVGFCSVVASEGAWELDNL